MCLKIAVMYVRNIRQIVFNPMAFDLLTRINAFILQLIFVCFFRFFCFPIFWNGIFWLIWTTCWQENKYQELSKSQMFAFRQQSIKHACLLVLKSDQQRPNLYPQELELCFTTAQYCAIFALRIIFYWWPIQNGFPSVLGFPCCFFSHSSFMASIMFFQGKFKN